MFIVGLTGGIATGKSSVAAVFREHGIPVIDADTIARKGYKMQKLFAIQLLFSLSLSLNNKKQVSFNSI